MKNKYMFTKTTQNLKNITQNDLDHTLKQSKTSISIPVKSLMLFTIHSMLQINKYYPKNMSLFIFTSTPRNSSA